MSNTNETSYPRALKDIEGRLLTIRRYGDERTGDKETPDVFADAVGVGLSGGGIRSATFCLGLFQGLVKQKLPDEDQRPDRKTLLSKIDYMSTVSGGGYFGSFYGRLFTRDPDGTKDPTTNIPGVAEFKDVEDLLIVRAALDEEATSIDGKFPQGKVFRWLRENGRYLAPKGSGDLMLGGAVFLRNWAAVQVVWGTFVLMLFLVAQFMRGLVEVSGAGPSTWWTSYQKFLVNRMPRGCQHLWWSPYTILIAIALLFLVVPPAWSYWLVEKPHPETAGRNWWSPLWGLGALFALALPGALYGLSPGSTHFWSSPVHWLEAASPARKSLVSFLKQPAIYRTSIVLEAIAIETALWAFVNQWIAAFRLWTRDSDVRETLTDKIWLFIKRLIAALYLFISGADDTQRLIDKNEQTRNQLSRQLKATLVIAVALLAFVIIDTLAQTGYGAWLSGQLHVKRWAVAVFGPLFGLAGFARTIFSGLGGGGANKKISISITTLAGVAAFVVGVLVLTAFDFGAYAIAWDMLMPSGPRPQWNATAKTTSAETVSTAAPGIDAPRCTICVSEKPKVPACGSHARYADLAVTVAALAVTFLFSFLFGRSWPFLNRSTYHPIYTSRLIRAYLGASNPQRLKRKSRDVTETIEGDDIRQEGYWPRFAWLETTEQTKPGNDKNKTPTELENELFKKGMPIHLVNVTINETVDAASQVEQHDRKGMGMAIGPAGLSIAVKHHLVLKDSADHLDVYPPKAPPSAEGSQKELFQPFRVFDFDGASRPERLTLGNWTGISGAAFSTSLGWRTSLSLSLLAGLANVRLSYWWNSGTKNIRGKGGRGLVSSVFQTLFSLQDFLFDEFLARFHGTARQYWPLSDGGHFENMGGYELIRRRLPMIIIVDAEADPDYTFEGLSNLVRKARLDFGAEVRFLTEVDLNDRVNGGVRQYFGTIDQLRRGKWVEEPVADPNLPNRKRQSIDQVEEEALSLAHVALADVFYEDGHRSLLLYIKPTLIGDEPADVRRYHTEHPPFPHESTAEQFFDEAQWESYRRLGEHIADKVFRSRDDQGQPITTQTGKFLPYLLHA